MNDDKILKSLSKEQAQALSNKLMYFYSKVTGDKMETAYLFLGAFIEQIYQAASAEDAPVTPPAHPEQPQQPQE